MQTYRSLHTTTKVILPGENRFIIQSPNGKYYEIWQENPLMLFKKIPQKKVVRAVPERG